MLFCFFYYKNINHFHGVWITLNKHMPLKYQFKIPFKAIYEYSKNTCLDEY